MSKRECLIYLCEYGQIPYTALAQCFLATDETNYLPILKALLNQCKKTFHIFYNQYPPAFFAQLYCSKKIVPICIFDVAYPTYLKEVYQPPFVLFTQGRSDFLATQCLAVVGSRKLSVYGEKCMAALIPDLSIKFGIVSGLARGCDTYAHEITMRTGGQTIAVIGTGLLTSYPKENEKLQRIIGQQHLLVSPLPCLAGVRKWHFPYRNRVIAGLSLGTLVIEAAERSGSLITANVALAENRNVYAVPGDMFHPLAKGTNLLIQAGAKAVISPQDIFDDFTYLWN